MTTPKGWTQHPSGQTQVFPVTGWKTAGAMDGKAGVLRIEFALDPTMENRDSRQLIMRTAQLRALSETLVKLADKLDQQVTDLREGPIS